MNVKAWLKDANEKTNSNETFNSELERFFYYVSLESKRFNDQNLLPIINFNAIDVNFQGSITFNELVPATGNYRMETIKKLASLMIGVNIGQIDYFFSDDWIKDNYHLYKDLLPVNDERYYNAIVNEDKPIYYCDFKSNPKIIPINQTENDGLGFSNQITKTKSTSAGRAFSEQTPEQKAAFAHILLLPSIIVLIILIILIVYIYFFY